MRLKNVQAANVKQLLAHYVKRGKLERVGKGKYKKALEKFTGR